MVELGDTLLDLIFVRVDQQEVEEVEVGWTVTGFEFYLLGFSFLISWLWTLGQYMMSNLKDLDYSLLIYDTGDTQSPLEADDLRRYSLPHEEGSSTMTNLSRPVANRNTRSRKNVIFRPTRRVLSCADLTKEVPGKTPQSPGGNGETDPEVVTLHPYGVWLPQAPPGELGPVLQTHRPIWKEFAATERTEGRTKTPDQPEAEVDHATNPIRIKPKYPTKTSHDTIDNQQQDQPPSVSLNQCTCSCSPIAISLQKNSESTYDKFAWKRSCHASTTSVTWKTADVYTRGKQHWKEETCPSCPDGVFVVKLKGGSPADLRLAKDSPSSSASRSGHLMKYSTPGPMENVPAEDTTERMRFTREIRHKSKGNSDYDDRPHIVRIDPTTQPANFNVSDSNSSMSVDEAVTDLLSGNFDIICSKYAKMDSEPSSDTANTFHLENEGTENKKGEGRLSSRSNQRDEICRLRKTRQAEKQKICGLGNICQSPHDWHGCNLFQRRKQKQKIQGEESVHSVVYDGPHVAGSKSVEAFQNALKNARHQLGNEVVAEPRRKYRRLSSSSWSPRQYERISIEQSPNTTWAEPLYKLPGHHVKHAVGVLNLPSPDDTSMHGQGESDRDRWPNQLPHFKKRIPSFKRQPSPYFRGSEHEVQKMGFWKRSRDKGCFYQYSIPHKLRYPFDTRYNRRQHRDMQDLDISHSEASTSAPTASTSSDTEEHPLNSTVRAIEPLRRTTKDRLGLPWPKTRTAETMPHNIVSKSFVKDRPLHVVTERPPITPRRKRRQAGHTILTQKPPVVSRDQFTPGEEVSPSTCPDRELESPETSKQAHPASTQTESSPHMSDEFQISPPSKDQSTHNHTLPANIAAESKEPQHETDRLTEPLPSGHKSVKSQNRTKSSQWDNPRKKRVRMSNKNSLGVTGATGNPAVSQQYPVNDNSGTFQNNQIVSSNESLGTMNSKSANSKSGSRVSKLPVYMGRRSSDKAVLTRRARRESYTDQEISSQNRSKCSGTKSHSPRADVCAETNANNCPATQAVGRIDHTERVSRQVSGSRATRRKRAATKIQTSYRRPEVKHTQSSKQTATLIPTQDVIDGNKDSRHVQLDKRIHGRDERVATQQYSPGTGNAHTVLKPWRAWPCAKRQTYQCHPNITPMQSADALHTEACEPKFLYHDQTLKLDPLVPVFEECKNLRTPTRSRPPEATRPTGSPLRVLGRKPKVGPWHKDSRLAHNE